MISKPVVFEQHSRLAALKQRLIRAGASPAMMTGSGSALFGLFRDRDGSARARSNGSGMRTTFPISLVSRARYRALWRRALEPT